MKYFFDTEFFENGKTIDLFSIGIVCEDGRELYAEHRDFDATKCIDTMFFTNDFWVWDHVIEPIVKVKRQKEYTNDFEMFHMLREYLLANGCSKEEIKNKIIEFIGDDESPQFYAYYAAYDWVVFCQIFGRMIDLPKKFPMYCVDLKQKLDDLNLNENWKNYHCSNPLGEHNALIDAKWNMKLYKNLEHESLRQLLKL